VVTSVFAVCPTGAAWSSRSIVASARYSCRTADSSALGGLPRSVKRGILEWIVQAKRPETRAKRVAETAERASRNERANQWRPS
jgi:Bacteriocin-protection, YdeI or OmpD-Associated